MHAESSQACSITLVLNASWTTTSMTIPTAVEIVDVITVDHRDINKYLAAAGPAAMIVGPGRGWLWSAGLGGKHFAREHTSGADLSDLYTPVVHLAMEALKCYSESSEDEHSSVSETGITKTGVSCIHLEPTFPSESNFSRDTVLLSSLYSA